MAPAPGSKWFAEGVDPDFAPASTTLNALFADWTARFAGRVAIDYNDRELTYEGLARESARVAAGLRRLGIGKGDVVEGEPEALPQSVEPGGRDRRLAYTPLAPATIVVSNKAGRFVHEVERILPCHRGFPPPAASDTGFALQDLVGQNAHALSVKGREPR